MENKMNNYKQKIFQPYVVVLDDGSCHIDITLSTLTSAPIPRRSQLVFSTPAEAERIYSQVNSKSDIMNLFPFQDTLQD
jgi:hypothetical protein